MEKKEKRSFGLWTLVGIVLVIFGVGALGAVSTGSSVGTWYMTLRKPSWTPPNWLFGPAWTTLYFLMSLSVWWVMRAGWERPEVRWAVGFFGVHMVLNALWSPLFFGLRWMGVALVEIVFLWASIVVLIVLFGRIVRGAALLLVPYLGWVSFATALNAALWWLNRAS